MPWAIVLYTNRHYVEKQNTKAENLGSQWKLKTQLNVTVAHLIKIAMAAIRGGSIHCVRKNFQKANISYPRFFGKFCGRTKLMITIFKKSSKCLLLTGAKNTKTFKNKIFASFWNFSYIYDSDISIPFETNWFHQTRKFMNSWWLIKTKLIQKFRDAVIVSMS